MGVCLTTTIDKQRKVYDLGSRRTVNQPYFHSARGFRWPGWKATSFGISSSASDFKSSIQFAINLLEFSVDNGYLRSTLYWSLLSKTMVIENLHSAQIYRQHLIQMRYPCPTILTRDGNMIASDGLMDPRRKCPRSLGELKFSFGALPPSERAGNKKLQETVYQLEELNQTVVAYEKTMDFVKMKEDQLRHQRSSLSPQITTLERELRKVRPAPQWATRRNLLISAREDNCVVLSPSFNKLRGSTYQHKELSSWGDQYTPPENSRKSIL